MKDQPDQNNLGVNRPLKIGLVLDDSLDTPDGVQQYVLTLGSWLTAQGHDVHYLVGATARTDIPNVHSMSRNMKVKFNGNRMSMPLPASRRKIRALLKREQFDVLHVQMPYSPFLAGRIIKAASQETAVIGTFHVAPNSHLVTLGNSLLAKFVRKSLERFDEVIAVSSVAHDFARKTFGIYTDVIPNTFNLTPYMSATALPQYKNELTVVFVGRLVERKGCQYLLHAAARMKQNNRVKTPYKIIICGKGELEQQLKDYVSLYELQNIVEFTGFIEESDKPRYMASADIAVFPSTGGESFGIVLIESMAASRGVVLAGDNPGYASVIGKHTEQLFDPHNTDAFAEKLEAYLNDPGLRTRARDWQKADVRQYDVAVVGQKMVEVYRQMLRKR